MDIQWWVLGPSLALTALAVCALVRPNWLVRDNNLWSACAVFAGENAGWLAAASVLLLIVSATTGAFAHEPGRLAALLLAVSTAGHAVVARRARRTPGTLESALRSSLGHGYLVQPTAEPATPGRPPQGGRVPRSTRRLRGVERIADVPYPGGHARNVLDVYRPAAGCCDAPVLMQIHGGAWTRGDKRRDGAPLIRHLVSRGWIVVAPNYRLGPSVRMPAPLIDLKAAMTWVRGHVAGYGGDPSFVAVSGSGAGAHLAALLALTFEEQDLQPGFEHVDTRPAACVPLHGVYDLADRRHRHPGRRARLRWLARHLMPCPLERDALAWDMASPLARLRGDAPPFFVLHGTHDALSPVEESREFARALARVSDEPVVYAALEGAHHGWDRRASARTGHTTRAVARFLDWCAERHRTQGSLLGRADRARS